MTKFELMNMLCDRKDRSAWSKGVTLYAMELLEDTDPEKIETLASRLQTTYNIPTFSEFDHYLMNGAQNWKQYSWGGCSLIYDQDIAKRLCTETELKRTDYGRKQPNKREQWLDVQARALFQAAMRIRGIIYDNR